MAIRNVITTLTANGEEILGPDILLWHYPQNDIINGTLLTVESNHFCVLKSRGAVLAVYETGQYQVETPQKLLLGSIQQAFFGGTSPWQYEALYINRAKLLLRATGRAYSREMAELEYTVDYYIHVNSAEDALKLVQHLPYRGHFLKSDEVNAYAAPVVEQAINQVVQVTPLEQINEKIHDLSSLVKEHLDAFLAIFGIHLNEVKVLIAPTDPRMRELIALRAFGLGAEQAARFYLALAMASKGLISAPNAMSGHPFQIGTGLLADLRGQSLGLEPGGTP